jgi:hypothetical protein
MFRGNGDNLGATNGAKQRYYDNPPPVPTLPGQFNAKETKMETVAETQDNNNNGNHQNRITITSAY